MFERFLMLLVLLNLVNQFTSLSYALVPGVDFQQVVLKRLGLKGPPSLVKSNRTTACIEYLKDLRNSGDQYNEVECLDPLELGGTNFRISLPKPLKSDKVLALRIFRSRNAKIKKFVARISVGDDRQQKEMTGDGWLEIDLSELLPKNDRKEINFKIELFSLDMAKKLSFEQIGIAMSGHYRPFLVSKRRNISKRTKRQAESTETEDEEDLGPYLPEYDDQSKACEAVPIYYKFDDYGWDNWIISPKGFSSTFCQGKCSFPLKSDLRPTNHAIIQSLMQLMYPERFPEPCCSPDETEALQIVYFDKNNRPKFRRLHNLIIKSCRCI